MIAYLVALAAALPARFMLDPGPRWAVGGTIWNGEAVLDGAWRVEWRWSPVRTLSSFAFASDVRISGAGTDIAGAATLWRQHTLLEGLSGRGDATLLAGLLPRLPFACDGSLQIDMPRLLLAHADSAAVGEVRLQGATCTPIAGGSATTPPTLVARAFRVGGDTRIEIAPAGQQRLVVVDGGISNGRIHVAPTPVGRRMMPFLAALSIDEAL